MQILDLWGVGFHAVVVFGLGKDFLFKSILGRCVAPFTIKRTVCWNLIVIKNPQSEILNIFHSVVALCYCSIVY